MRHSSASSRAGRNNSHPQRALTGAMALVVKEGGGVKAASPSGEAVEPRAGSAAPVRPARPPVERTAAPAAGSLSLLRPCPTPPSRLYD